MKTNKIQNIKIVILSVTLTFYYSLKILFLSFIGKHQRQKVNAIANAWAKSMLRIAKVNYQIFNPQQVAFAANRTYVVMSNHASHYDIPLIFVTFPNNVRMISKKELSRVPFWGRAMRIAEIMFIDRNNPKQSRLDMEVVKQQMLTGIIPWIAPEGTRTRTGQLQPFKRGGFVLAQQAKAIIVPVAIIGSRQILPPKTLQFQPNQQVTIHICNPIDTANYRDDETQRLIADVRSAIELQLVSAL